MSVTLASLKAHLNVTTTDDDDLITEKLSAASDWVSKYTGGDPNATDAPPAVDEAVRRIAADLYENREASIVGATAETLPFGVLELLEPYRAWAF